MRHQERVFEWLYPLSCHQAERLISRDLDGQLFRSERNLLRVHLRSCADCVRFERLQLHSRAALRSFDGVSETHVANITLKNFNGTGVELKNGAKHNWIENVRVENAGAREYRRLSRMVRTVMTGSPLRLGGRRNGCARFSCTCSDRR